MSLVLKNKNISLEFHAAEEGYSGTRFSGIGKLVTVKFQGISFTTNELKRGFSVQHGAGFYNEFDIDTALGYDEVEKGDWFHKIGVGLLQKDDEVYDFFKKYSCRNAHFQMESGDNSIVFRAIQEEHQGYGYELQQTYTLNDYGFTIEYTLNNTGQKSIKTSEYNHNFLQLNQEAIGPSYELNLFPELTMTENSAFVNPEELVVFNSAKLKFDATPKKDYFISDLQAKKGAIVGWELVLNDFKVAAKTDFMPSKMNIWGNGHVISPELFAEIQVEPGQQTSWSRWYEFQNG